MAHASRLGLQHEVANPWTEPWERVDLQDVRLLAIMGGQSEIHSRHIETVKRSEGRDGELT